MECSRCGTDKPATPKYYPVFHGKLKGKVCRDCKNKRDGHQKPMSGICQHCHKPIVGRPKNTRYHTDEAHPDCYSAKMEHMRVQQRIYDRGAGKVRRKALSKAAPIKKCTRCKTNPVKKGNYFYCETCFEWASRVPEEFQGW